MRPRCWRPNAGVCLNIIDCQRYRLRRLPPQTRRPPVPEVPARQVKGVIEQQQGNQGKWHPVDALARQQTNEQLVILWVVEKLRAVIPKRSPDDSLSECKRQHDTDARRTCNTKKERPGICLCWQQSAVWGEPNKPALERRLCRGCFRRTGFQLVQQRFSPSVHLPCILPAIQACFVSSRTRQGRLSGRMIP